MSLLKRLLLTGKGGGGGAPAPIFPMEYLYVEGTSSPYNIYYDDLAGSGSYLVAQTESPANGLMDSSQRKLARMSDGTLYACYSRQVAGKYQVHVKKSIDEGVNWIDEVLISTGAGMNIQNQIASCMAVDSNNHLHIVWHGRAAAPYTTVTKIWHAYYDGSWNMTANPLDIGVAGMETIANDTAFIAIDSNDYLHVVFRGRSTVYTNIQIWYVKYVTSWSTPIRVSIAAGMEGFTQHPWPTIAIDSNDYIHVSFAGNSTAYPNSPSPQIFRALYDGSWAVDRVSNGMTAYHNSSSLVVIDSNDIHHVAWVCTSFANNRIYYSRYNGSWAVSTYVVIGEIPSISIDSDDYINIVFRGLEPANKIWLAQYIVGWIMSELQSTGENTYPCQRWSNHP